MIRKPLPGQRSNITLIVTSLWTILGLFILIIGHLTLVFFVYGKMTGTEALVDLANYLMILEPKHLYIVAGLAIVADVWIMISYKKQREHKIQR